MNWDNTEKIIKGREVIDRMMKYYGYERVG